jgi:hypothetical protein
MQQLFCGFPQARQDHASTCDQCAEQAKQYSLLLVQVGVSGRTGLGLAAVLRVISVRSSVARAAGGSEPVLGVIAEGEDTVAGEISVVLFVQFLPYGLHNLH